MWGCVLLNAFNALEYGEPPTTQRWLPQARSVFDSYLVHGFTSGGLIREFVDFERGKEPDVYTIRRQSEGLYALLCYLHYEETRGRSHPEWEVRIRTLLTRLLTLQQPDGSFPRKFRDDLQVVDAAGGSTPSATLPLAMAYRQFGQKIYRDAARRTADYLDHNLIAKADYFSSTLDANCEDKEASLLCCHGDVLYDPYYARRGALPLCRPLSSSRLFCPVMVLPVGCSFRSRANVG